jgi:hypothetical protein
MSSIASCSHHRTVGTLADTTSLQAALVVVPVMIVLAAVRLTLVSRVLTRVNGDVLAGPPVAPRGRPSRGDRVLPKGVGLRDNPALAGGEAHPQMLALFDAAR